MLTEGALFGPYEVRRRIGAGGMGEIYLCRHRLLDRLDAVKVLRTSAVDDPRFRQRFVREALIAAKLRHPHIVAIYTADEADGQLYLAMQYVPGRNLAEELAGGSLSPARTGRLIAVVADALDAGHRAGFVHRDIKPSNLIVSDPGTPAEAVTLVDFGISRMVDSGAQLTGTGEFVGTVAYSAPEQIEGQATPTGACDQYALACVAYECLTGQVPYPYEGTLAIAMAHLTAPPPKITEVRPDLPAALDAVIVRGLAKNPAQRYPTCTDFAAALVAAMPVPVAEDPAFPGPAGLRAQLEAGRVPGSGGLRLRVGQSTTAAMIVSLTTGPLAVRGEPGPVAATARWLIAQVAARFTAREVCLAGALAPTDDDTWLWINWLSHARPATLPLVGPHYATQPDAAADLLQRLHRVIQVRRPDASAQSPRLLAVLDHRLGVSLNEAGLDRIGVHVVQLLPAAAPVPAGTSTLDVAADGQSARLAPAAGPAVTGVPDQPTAAEVRHLVDLLPDD